MRTTARPCKQTPFRPTPLAAALACVLASQGAMAVTYTVTSPAQAGPGTLAEAVGFANSNCFTDPNPVIHFNLPAPAPFVIAPAGTLTISCATGPIFATIDGSTQPGSTPNTSTTGFNAAIPIAIDGGSNFGFNGIFSVQDFGYGSQLTVRGLELRNYTYGGFSAALQGNVRLYGSVVHGNSYGVDPSGTQSRRAAIGAAAPADRNLIRNNLSAGIVVSYGGWVDINNNLIGTDASGLAGAPNGKGISLQAFDGVTIVNNVVSGNTNQGISIADYPYLTSLAPPTMIGNKIGHGATGTPVPNGGDGIFLSAVSNAQILNNVIASNGGNGVGMVDGFGSTLGALVSQNSIHSNAGKNIDLDFYGGPLPNDLLDVDVGPNLRQNHPVISLVTQSGGNTLVQWTFNSNPSSTFQLQFFANAAAGTPAGTTYLTSSANQSTDAAGNVSGTQVITGLHNNISATAINQSFGDTSEFSSAVALTPTPEVTITPASPVTFPNTVVGASSAATAVTLASVGTAPYTINQFDTAPTCYGGPICASGSFTCSNACTTGTPYAPSTSCSISVNFTPSVLGPQTTTFYVCDNAAGSPRAITLTGTGIAPPPPTVSPPSFDFGSVAVGGTSTPQTFTITNPSPAATSLSAFAVTGPYVIVSTTCTASLAAGASCGADVRFAPTVAGPANGTLTATAGSGPISATLTGTATPPPPTTIAPVSFDFGSLVIGSTSAPAAFTVTNPALVPVTLSPFTVTPPFALASTTCTTSLSPGASCVANATFSPVTTGVFNGTISATAGGGIVAASVAGTGTPVPPPPQVTVTPTSLDFGSVTVGTVSAPQAFAFTNPGTADMPILAPTTTGPYVILSTTCASPLPATSSCVTNVKFAPTAPGPQPGTLVLEASTGPVTATLNGTGVAASPLTVSPPAFDFGTVLVGASSATRTFTVMNPGASIALLSGLATSGPFAVASTNCATSLAPSASCDANVRFTPAANGPASGSLLVNSSAGLSSAILAGNGLLQALLDFPAGTIELGTTTLGSAPVQRVITLRNAGNAALTIDSIRTAAPFSLTSTCPLNLLPGEACTVAIEHNPTALGDFTGSLVIMSNAPGGSRSIPVHVQVQARPEPVIRVTPASIGFGDRMAGTQSSSQRVTIANEGGADAAGLQVAIDNVHFLIVNTTCGTSLAPQSTCFADLAFRPLGFGPKRGAFAVGSNAEGSPHRVNLSGAGCRPVAITQGRGGTRLNCSP